MDNIIEMTSLFVPIILISGAFLLAFGLRYLTNRERMALIEKGMNPTIEKKNKGGIPFGVLRCGFMLFGAGLGLLCFIITQSLNLIKDNDIVTTLGPYPFFLIFTGIGLLISYYIEYKHIEKLK